MDDEGEGDTAKFDGKKAKVLVEGDIRMENGKSTGKKK